MPFQLQRPPLLPSILTLIGITILCSLGAWQLQRLEWKTTLIASLEDQYKTAPQPIDLSALPQRPHVKRVSAQGFYLSIPAIPLGPRVHNKEIGVHLYALFMLQSGNVILVNRGWSASNSDISAPPSGPKTLTGLLSAPPRRNRFTPQNIPEKNEWYHPDTKEIAAYLGLEKLAPAILTLDETELTPVSPAQNLKNDHLGYAIFWFATALSLLVIFILRFIRNPD